MPGRPRKQPNALAGHRQKPSGPLQAVPAPAAVLVQPREIPPVPRGLLKRSREIWERFWSSDLPDQVDNAGVYRVERWIRSVDELERAWRLFRQQRFVTGSMGQQRLNPVWGAIQDLEGLVGKAEEQLGMTPLARARLGLTLGVAAGATVDDLNQRMNEPDEPLGPRVLEAPKPKRGSKPKTIEGDFTPL